MGGARRLTAALERRWRSLGEAAPGCAMCDGLYLRANGALPCWCGPGEAVIHRRLDARALPVDVANLPEIRAVRRAFAEGRVPFPGVCEACQATRAIPRRDLTEARRHLRELHVEPSFWCNLGCAMCPPDNAARRAAVDGDMNLPLPLARALVADLRASGVEAIDLIRLEGKGDPLLHPEIEALSALLRGAFPRSFLVLTTSGSFPPRPGLRRCGLDEVVLSADGFTDATYARYRVGGQLEKVKAFARALAAPGGPRVVWKYILFEWNDSEEELAACWRFCLDLGIQLELRLTHSEGASLRWDGAALAAFVAERLPGARADATYLRQRAEAQVRGDEARLRALGVRR